MPTRFIDNNNNSIDDNNNNSKNEINANSTMGGNGRYA